jgi:hypothetical protein
VQVFVSCVDFCIAVGDSLIKSDINMDSTIAGSVNDNINMDSTIAGSVNDNINMDSTIT